jgi:transcriptional regulator with XRE-family HTH domain
MKSQESSFGAELYAARTRRGLTQADVALKAQLGRGYYSQLENSRKGPPSHQALTRIIDALGTDEHESKQLISLAIAERCKPVRYVKGLSPEVRQLLKCIFERADRITPETAIKIETILTEN